jgi:hypothetical protein
VERHIAGFALDDEGHWVALLDCGHRQHMRHRPPFEQRQWVTNPEGRASRLGVAVNCPHCDGQGPASDRKPADRPHEG